MRAVPLVVCLLALPVAAAAQMRAPAVRRSSPVGWDGPFRISVNVGGQFNTDGTLAQNFTVTRNVEPAPISASIDNRRAILIDVAGAYRVRGRLAVAYAFSATSHDTSANVTAQIPHPFFFNRARTIAGTTPISQSARVSHVSAAYVVPSRRVEVMLLGGPSFFSISQPLVTDVQYRDEYPYEQANIAFTGAPTTLVEQNMIGFHVGGDVAVKLTQNIGAGVLARFSRGTATLSAASGNSVPLKAGGFQLGGGVRVAF